VTTRSGYKLEMLVLVLTKQKNSQTETHTNNTKTVDNSKLSAHKHNNQQKIHHTYLGLGANAVTLVFFC